MNPKIESFRKHGAERLLPGNIPPRTPGYGIVGKGFGDQPGTVEIEYARDDETLIPHIKFWSPDLIEIEQPGSDPYDWSVWINDLFVTSADSKRSKPFEIVRPGNPYDGYVRPQDRAAPVLRQAA